MNHDLKHISPHLRLKVSPRARRMALRLDAKARIVNLVVPRRVNMDKALDFARQHKDWIQTQILDLPAPIPFTHGCIIPLNGQDTFIDITYDETLKRTNILLKNNKIIVSTNKADPSSRIIRFLKNHAQDTLTALAHEKAATIGKTIQSVKVRDTKSRWGSCADGGHLCFSWRLIFAPPHALDYVVAHEVAHLIHMDHSPKFWQRCAELSRDYIRGKRWMRENGYSLLSYGHDGGDPLTPGYPDKVERAL